MTNTIKHTATAGETWDSIAFSYFADEFKADAIIKANIRYKDVLIFEGGEVLTIPQDEETTAADTLPPWRR